MKKIEIRKTGKGKRVATYNEEPSKTDQQFASDVDINSIVEKMTKGIAVNSMAKIQGIYADVSQITDLQEAIDTVKYADEAFASLPSHLREKFQNDPRQMIDFLSDNKNDQEAVKLGLKKYPEHIGPDLHDQAESKRERASSETKSSSQKTTPKKQLDINDVIKNDE